VLYNFSLGEGGIYEISKKNNLGTTVSISISSEIGV
jgi:hypothetical protein